MCYCKNCGNQLSEDAVFCRVCGTEKKIEQDVYANQYGQEWQYDTYNQEEFNDYNYYQGEGQTKKQRYIWIVAIVLLCLVIAAGVVVGGLVINQKKKNAERAERRREEALVEAPAKVEPTIAVEEEPYLFDLNNLEGTLQTKNALVPVSIKFSEPVYLFLVDYSQSGSKIVPMSEFESNGCYLFNSSARVKLNSPADQYVVYLKRGHQYIVMPSTNPFSSYANDEKTGMETYDLLYNMAGQEKQGKTLISVGIISTQHLEDDAWLKATVSTEKFMKGSAQICLVNDCVVRANKLYPSNGKTNELATTNSAENDLPEQVVVNDYESLKREMAEADDLFLAGDVNAAFDRVSEIAEKYKSNEEWYSKACDRRQYFSNYLNAKSKIIMNDHVTSQNKAYGNDKLGLNYVNCDSVTFSSGESYKNFIMFIVSQGNNSPSTKYVKYGLDQKYTRLSGAIGVDRDLDSDKFFHLEIYGDDRLLGTTESINTESGRVPFEVDVRGIDTLEIRCVREDYNLTYANKQPALSVVDLFVYNDDIEFERFN